MILSNAVSRLREYGSLIRLTPFDVDSEEGRGRERRRRVVLTSVALLAAKGIGLFSTIISVPLALGYLGEERFGLWATLSTLIAFLFLTDLGIGSALVNVVAAASGQNDERKITRAVSTGAVVLTAQGAALIAVFLLVHRLVDWSVVFNLKSEEAKAEIGTSLLVLVSVMALQLPLTVVQRLQEGYQEAYVNHFWQAVGGCLGLTGLILAVQLNLGLPWLVGALAGAPALASFVNAVIQFTRVRPWLGPRASDFDGPMALHLMGTGGLFTLLSLLSFLGLSSDTLVITRQIGSAAVTDYAVVQRLSLIANLLWVLIIPLWPAYGEAMSRGDKKWVGQTFRISLLLSLGAGFVVALAIGAFGPAIAKYWTGHDMREQTLLFYGFAAYVLISGPIGSISVVLNSSALRAHFLILSVAALTSFALKVVLSNHLGVAGVVWATVLAYSVLYIAPGTWAVWKRLAH